MNEKTVVRAIEVTLVAFVLLLLLAEALTYYPPIRPSIGEQDRLTPETNSTVFVHASLQATFAAHAISVDYARNTSRSFPVVYYYFDALYPMSFSDLQDWYGLTQHLSVVADARGYVLNLQLVDAAQLALLLQDPTSEGDLVIMASGVLPATIFTAQKDLLLPWLQGGGTLIWLGDLIGAYSGMIYTTSVTPGPGNPGKNGSAHFLNTSWLGGTTSLYDSSSPFVSNFAFQYPYGIRGLAFNASAVKASGATVLGPIVSGFTNLVALPIGRGTLIDLAAPPYDVLRLSISLVNAIQAGVLGGPYQVLRNQTANLTPNVPFVTDAWVPIPSTLATLPSAEFCRFTAQTDYLATFATESCVSV